jgi:large conductance mechanosensitive channel
MSILQDFKTFVLRGNMVDLAIGFTVGAAFTTVVKSLVDDIIMPPIGVITGNADFADHFWVLRVPEGVTVPENGFATLAAAQQAGVATLNYGRFINTALALLIVAIAMFAIVRLVNRLEAQLDEAFGEETREPEEPTEKKCEYCRSTIPYRATRCPQCTSHLEPKVTEN